MTGCSVGRLMEWVEVGMAWSSFEGVGGSPISLKSSRAIVAATWSILLTCRLSSGLFESIDRVRGGWDCYGVPLMMWVAFSRLHC